MSNNNKNFYWRCGNSPLTLNMKYDAQCWDDPAIQNFMLDELSESKPASDEREGPGVTCVISIDYQ